MVKNSAGTSTLRSQNWVYDGVGNMTSRTIEGVTTTYSYDNIHQLITESRSGSLLEYTYDANGNRLSKTLNSGTPSTYTYADDDRLLTTPHGTITYDAAGRPTAYPISSTVTRYFSWDYDDRLLGYSNTSGGALVEAHKYNGAGARVEFSSGGTTRKDLRTGIGVTAPVVSSAVGGSTTVSYLPGIAEKRGSTKSYQHSGLKNVDAQSNSSATISATREYDAFGGEISATGTFNGPFGHAGNFGYQSEGSGLQLLGHRWYDPEVGRFLTRDPIQDGKNWFAYCANNPLASADPEGLASITIRVERGTPGHAWIIIRWDDGTVWVIENNMSGNLTLTTSGDSEIKKKVGRKFDNERTVIFDENGFSKDDVIAIMTGNAGNPNEYNLTTNNCCHFAVWIWGKVTGEDEPCIQLRTPPNTDGGIALNNRKYGGNLGDPMKIGYRDRLSPSKRQTIGGGGGKKN